MNKSLNILYFSCHEILEYDDLRMFTELGHRVFSLGDFAHPEASEKKFRPGRPEFFHKAFWDSFQEMGCNLPGRRVTREFCRLFDLVIINHNPSLIDVNLNAFGNMPIILRTLGQSRLSIEKEYMKYGERIFIVRYSETERDIVGFAKTDAVVYFGKYESDWPAWKGGDPGITFHNTYKGRNSISYPKLEEWITIRNETGCRLYGAFNENIPEASGLATYAQQLELYNSAAFYLYVYTQPPSYTLSFIESLMAGVPVIAPSASMIAATSSANQDDAWSEARYEIPKFLHGSELSLYENVEQAIAIAKTLKTDREAALRVSEQQKENARKYFDAKVSMNNWNQVFSTVVGSMNVARRNGSKRRINTEYAHPYRGKPETSFWDKAVATVALDTFDPVVSVPFKISKANAVATAGSCFAQHISRSLKASGFNFLQTEEPPGSQGAEAKVALFSARYGNIYTCKQLRQLFERAYAVFEPRDVAWRRDDGRYIDPFRQQEIPEGFDSVEDVVAARRQHLAAVRTMFQKCNVFVFTLGLTESWVSGSDGAAFPLPPGVIGVPDWQSSYQPVNQTVESMTADLLWFIDELRELNPNVRFVLTVSPVPLIATFENRHVLVSNTYSKAALRVVAEQVCLSRLGVMYFPSFEIVNAMPRLNLFEADLRNVTQNGVDFVMSIFQKHCLSDNTNTEVTMPMDQLISKLDKIEDKGGLFSRSSIRVSSLDYEGVICDEEMLGKVN
jgi:hypothetical protein